MSCLTNHVKTSWSTDASSSGSFRRTLPQLRPVSGVATPARQRPDYIRWTRFQSSLADYKVHLKLPPQKSIFYLPDSPKVRNKSTPGNNFPESFFLLFWHQRIIACSFLEIIFKCSSFLEDEQLYTKKYSACRAWFGDRMMLKYNLHDTRG